jgi:hypothetical protein
MKLYPQNLRVSRRARLEELTIAGFGGGLNAVESDITMRQSYLVALSNFRRTASGSQESRFGSNWFADVASVVTGTIVDSDYFASTIITPTTTGQVAAVDSSGAVVAIWNSTLAALLPGTPTGWSAGLDSIDFVPFRDELVIHNGIDKPITIDQNLDVTYLQDLATGSNVNVPIGKYGCVVANYHCVAGIPAALTTVYISSKGTAGTFPGDPAPNDSISIDVGAYAPEGAPEIRGIAGFRSYLIVFFAGAAIPIQLGVYDADGNHTPTFPDSLPSFGLLGHRCLTSVVNDLRFANFGNLASVKRNIFGGVDGDTMSDIIEPAYRADIGALTGTQQLKGCFVVYDSAQHDTAVYLPGGIAWVYNNNEKLKYRAWTRYTGPAWTSGCVSSLGRVFLTFGTRIFQQGNGVFASEAYRADRLNDRDGNWTTGHSYFVDDLARDTITDKSYICIRDHVSGGSTFSADRAAQILNPAWEEYTGTAISIEMEMPWIRGRNPMQQLQCKFLAIQSSGTAPFMLSVWVDNLFEDVDGNIVYDPAMVMEFIGNDAAGFGYDAGPYGGGRRSNDPRLWDFPLKFKSLKMRITGSIKKPLEIAGFTFLYNRGKWRR